MKNGTADNRTLVFVVMMALLILMIIQSITSCVGVAKDKLKKAKQGVDKITLTARSIQRPVS